ncbi:MAG TPA: nitroreductase family protein [Phycisphaerae bacterium]|nr:nitroreductase family protein [Phycisphaerae bacterium]
MTFEELIVRNRSYRRYDQAKAVSMETLRDLVDIARRTPSAANRQPLKYVLVADGAGCARLFPHLAWAGALKDWPGPAQGERPAAYVVILCDTEIAKDPGCDHGIAAQSMLVAAVERGLGGCMLGAIDRKGIREDFGIPGRYEILLVVSLGVPAETCVLENADPGGDVTYYRDAESVHHVPKRRLDEVILRL